MVYKHKIWEKINNDVYQKALEISDINNGNTDAYWTVYCHIIPSSITNYDYDKYYVGQCGQKCECRWKHDGIGYKTQAFYKAIQKYGWNNIEHVILIDNLLSEQADWLEIELIKQLDSIRHGYNRSQGGKNGNGNKRKIAQYNLDGKLINVFESVKEAAVANGFEKYSVLYSPSHYHLGYLWYKFDGKPLQQVEPYTPRQNNFRYINRYTLKGEYIDSWPVTYAQKEFGYSVIRCCSGRYPGYGYQFRYADDKTPVHPVDNLIYQYSIDGEFIKTFYSLDDVRKELKLGENINRYHLHRNDACLERNVAFGYRWTKSYYEKLPPLRTYKSKGRPIVQIDIKTNNPIEIYSDAKSFPQGNGHIADVCRGERQSAFGYYWKYLDHVDYSFFSNNNILLQKYYSYMEDLDFRKSHVKHISKKEDGI